MTTPDHRPGRLAVLLLVGALVAAAGCEDEPSAGPAVADDRPAAAAAEAGPFPGLYVTPEIAASEQRPGWLRLVSALPCAEVQQVLTAGQWRRVDQLALTGEAAKSADLLAGFGMPPGVLLGRGEKLAYLAVRGDNSCTATVSAVDRGEVTIGGPGAPKAGPGWVATTGCQREADGHLSVSLMFDTDAKTGGWLTVELDADGTGYRVDLDHPDVQLSMLQHRGALLGSYSRLLDDEGRGRVGVRLRQFYPDDESAGTATTTPDHSAEQPGGTVRLTGLVDEEQGDRIDLTVPFRCVGVTG